MPYSLRVLIVHSLSKLQFWDLGPLANYPQAFVIAQSLNPFDHVE